MHRSAWLACSLPSEVLVEDLPEHSFTVGEQKGSTNTREEGLAPREKLSTPRKTCLPLPRSLRENVKLQFFLKKKLRDIRTPSNAEKFYGRWRRPCVRAERHVRWHRDAPHNWTKSIWVARSPSGSRSLQFNQSLGCDSTNQPRLPHERSQNNSVLVSRSQDWSVANLDMFQDAFFRQICTDSGSSVRLE